MADFFIKRLQDFERQHMTSQEKSRSSQKGEDIQAAQRNWNAYERLRDNGHSDWLKIARQCDAYYNGDQWEKDISDSLDSEGRPHVTVNQVLSTVNSILSEHVRTRQEISFLPRGRGATEEVASALTFVTKQVQYNNQSQWNEQQVVADGLIEDRGYFDIRISFDDNILGEIREAVLDPRDVLIDAGAKDYDPNTWKEVITTKWMTPDDIAVFYGQKKADLLNTRAVNHRYSRDSLEFESGTQTFGTADGDGLETHMNLDDTDTRAVRRIRIIERQWKKLNRGQWFVDPEEGDMRRVPGHWDEVRVAVHAATFDLDIIERPELRIRWTVSADDVLLHDDWSLYERFTVIPFFPYFRRGRPSGLVRHLLSPQDMLNKITSQELHVVNTTANSGWIFEQGSLINMDADDLEKIGAKTGLVLEYKAGTKNPPVKIQPNQVPTGLSHIATKAQVYFRNVSGLPEVFVSGQSEREVSGVAINEQKASGAGSLDVVWDNLAKTRFYRARFLLELIQQWYTETRLIQVTELNEDGDRVPQQMQINAPEVDEETAEERILNNLALGEYEVIVASQPQRETMQDTAFSQVMQMREAGITIPDHVAIENSRLDDRKEIASMVKKIQGLAEPTQQEVEMQLMQQQISIQGQLAQIREAAASAQLKEAQAQLALAKADAETQKPLLAMQQSGMKLRESLEKVEAELEQKLQELQTRLIISRDKNDTERYVTQVEAMGKRSQTQAQRETSLAKLALDARRERRSGANQGSR